eukprot:scaffold151488_cov33-Tisochrysis_lutea.AAC.7
MKIQGYTPIARPVPYSTAHLADIALATRHFHFPSLHLRRCNLQLEVPFYAHAHSPRLFWYIRSSTPPLCRSSNYPSTLPVGWVATTCQFAIMPHGV